MIRHAMQVKTKVAPFWTLQRINKLRFAFLNVHGRFSSNITLYCCQLSYFHVLSVESVVHARYIMSEWQLALTY